MTFYMNQYDLGATLGMVASKTPERWARDPGLGPKYNFLECSNRWGGAFSYFSDLRIYGFPRPPDPFHQTRSGLLYRKFTIWYLDPCMEEKNCSNLAD